MLYLALSILFSSLIFVVFKLYAKYGVQTLFAIIVNYFVACSVGLFNYSGPITLVDVPQKSWFWGSLSLGLLFILIFNLMAATSQKLGVSVASVATKMSLTIPVLFGVFFYKEILGILEIIGIILALLAVYFASLKEQKIKANKWAFALPVLVFLGSGVIDTSIKYVQDAHMPEEEYALFSATVFSSAGVIGLFYICLNSTKVPLKFNFKNIIGGICLGIPNYFSIFYLLKALQHPTWNSASVFTINNVAIVMFSTLLGIILFKERLTPKNWLGIVLAVCSIIMVAFGQHLTMLI
ncbi:GRP family sugar transporter [Maribacter confluentis]|uniref:GRP family sugar transporter n=1 Tax=Maribacter confluentis TaxID=1656093 RepID=A0ABT8RJR0_9FLAO|nr:GRP family sugar transporter [Maribacter confluentis]MDO1511271.1 GRP family sugar transporter [Maribacter confluentis]